MSVFTSIYMLDQPRGVAASSGRRLYFHTEAPVPRAALMVLYQLRT